MKAIIISAVISLSSALYAAMAHGPHDTASADVATILITDCKYDVGGIDVEFETGLPPPYVVGVFDISDSQFSARTRPLHSMVTSDKVVRLDGDFCSYCNSFVQVFTPDITNSLYFTTKHLVTTVTTNKFVYHYGPSSEKIVDEIQTKTNKHWVVAEEEDKFIPTMTTTERREMSGGKFDFKLTPYPKSMDDFVPSWGMGEAFYEGRSNMWPIRRLFTPMSASGGKVVALDWCGYIGYADAPEGVPDNKLIPSGIRFYTKKGTNP